MGGRAPADQSANVAAIEAARAREEREAAERERARKEEQFKTSLNSSYTSAIEQARNYFTEMGLDPKQFETAIVNAANEKKGAVPIGDLAPGSYFNSLGQAVYGQQTDAKRAKSLRDINSYSKDGFARDLIRDESDDSFINSILEEQYADAERRVQGQKARGTLNDYGMAEAIKDLQLQKSSARSNLDAIGGGVLEQGRSKLGNIASTGRTAAGQTSLGDTFDPFKYQRDINDEVAGFFSGLGDKVKGAAPRDLFDLTAAFQRGGSKQGVGNTGYDVAASAGIFDLLAQEDEDEKKKKLATTGSPF